MHKQPIPELQGKYAEAIYFYHYYRQFYKTVVVVTTFNCPIQCDHCYVSCGPFRFEKFSLNGLKEWLKDAKSHGQIMNIMITGGEPFVEIKRLSKLVLWAEEINLYTVAVTSGFWGKTLDSAREILKRIIGLTGLLLSIDRFHQAWVPLEYIKNIIIAAVEIGLPIGLIHCYWNEEDFCLISKIKQLLGQDLSSFIPILEGSLHFEGRAKKIFKDVQRIPISDLPHKPCTTANSMPILLPNSKMMACCGDAIFSPKYVRGLEIGVFPKDSFVEVRDRVSKNTLIQTLGMLGPTYLAGMVQKAGLDHLLKGLYQSENICDLCSDLFSHDEIVTYLTEATSSRTHLNILKWAKVLRSKE